MDDPGMGGSSEEDKSMGRFSLGFSRELESEFRSYMCKSAAPRLGLAMVLVTESARACCYYSGWQVCCNSAFRLLAGQITTVSSREFKAPLVVFKLVLITF